MRLRSGILLLMLATAVVWPIPPTVLLQSSFDNIAIIETDPSLLIPGELFDLEGATLRFSPSPSGGYTTETLPLSFESELGTRINLADNSSEQVSLGFLFAFFGSLFSIVFVSDNGYITFRSASNLNHFNAAGSVTAMGNTSGALSRFAGLVPRIAALWQDWDPSRGGVFSRKTTERLVLTWDDISLIGTSSSASFQVVLFNTGVVEISYRHVPVTPGGGYLVGISPGSSASTFVTTADFSSGPVSSESEFRTLEPIAQVFGGGVRPTIHLPAALRKFYRTFPDQFDQVAVFGSFEHELGGATAFEQNLRNTALGIGLNPNDVSSFFGSRGRLASVLNMNRLSFYPNDLNCLRDPRCRFPGNNDSPLSLMGQEAGHLWLAFVRYDAGGACSDFLLGRGLGHWNFFMDSDASVMEGNKWRDNRDGSFTTIDDTIRYGPLDQYIMGLRPPGEVPRFFLVADPSGTNRGRSSTPSTGITSTGRRRDITVNDVIQCSGPRFPEVGVSGINPTTTLKQAWLLVTPPGVPPSEPELQKLDTYRTAWESYFATATEGRGSVDTTLVTDGGGFVIVVNPANVVIPQTRTIRSPIDVRSFNDFDQPVSLNASAFPPNPDITTTLSTSVVQPGQVALLDITVAPGALDRVFNVVVTGTSGGLTSSTTLRVDAFSLNFFMGFSPATLTVPRGQTLETTLLVGRLGITGPVEITPPQTGPLKIKVKPGGISTVTGSSTTFRVRVKGGSPPGSYQLVFTGRDQTGRERLAELTVVVQ